MDLRICFNSSEDEFPLPAAWRAWYGPLGFPPAGAKRPYVTSNFVTGLDGRASFRELPGRAGGKEVSRSRADRWLFNFLLAHHDACLVGADTLRSEPGKDGRGWDLHLRPETLRQYRQEVLGLPRQVVIVLSGRGDLDLQFRLFQSDKVEPWIITSAVGAALLQPRLRQCKRPPKLIVVGQSPRIDLAEMLAVLRHGHGIQRLQCLGGPSLHGQLLQEGLLDESFLCISAQVLGCSTVPGIERPTAFGMASYIPATAPWFRMISLHHEGPHHLFVRLRHQGARTFPE